MAGKMIIAPLIPFIFKGVKKQRPHATEAGGQGSGSPGGHNPGKHELENV
jgi:hypothetical protein